MPVITIELPSGEITTLVISDTATLNDIADQLAIPSAMFFCSRLDNILGTFMDYASDELYSKFNTDRCVVLDSNHIPTRDQASVTEWLAVFGFPPS